MTSCAIGLCVPTGRNGRREFIFEVDVLHSVYSLAGSAISLVSWNLNLGRVPGPALEVADQRDRVLGLFFQMQKMGIL